MVIDKRFDTQQMCALVLFACMVIFELLQRIPRHARDGIQQRDGRVGRDTVKLPIGFAEYGLH